MTADTLFVYVQSSGRFAAVLGDRQQKRAAICPFSPSVPRVGLEPTIPKEREFESRASASSATSAYLQAEKSIKQPKISVKELVQVGRFTAVVGRRALGRASPHQHIRDHHRPAAHAPSATTSHHSRPTAAANKMPSDPLPS